MSLAYNNLKLFQSQLVWATGFGLVHPSTSNMMPGFGFQSPSSLHFGVLKNLMGDRVKTVCVSINLASQCLVAGVCLKDIHFVKCRKTLKWCFCFGVLSDCWKILWLQVVHNFKSSITSFCNIIVYSHKNM